MSEALRYSLRTQLTELLPRLRQTVPLPMDPMRIYSGAFSPQVSKWFVRRIPTSMHHQSVAYRNLLRATARQTIIHFNLTEPKKVDDWSEVNPDQPFWLRMQDCPVCPISKMNPFLLDDEVRNDPILQDWYRKADRLDAEIRYFHNKIYQLAPLFSSRNDIAKAWPEAVRAVPELVAGTRLLDSNSTGIRAHYIKEKMQQLITPVEKARLTDLLATAVLLPADTTLMAWIGYSREDE